MEDLKVLMVGNAPSVNGGITSVITQLLNFKWENNDIQMSFIPTYEEGSSFHKIVYFIKAYTKILRQIRREKPDVVHIHMSYRGSFLRKYAIHKLCVIAGIPDVVHLHGSEFKKWYYETNRKMKRRIRKMLRGCTALIVLGHQWEAAIKEIEPKTNIIVLSNTVRIPEETCSWNPERFQVMFLGVLIQRKGVRDLLDTVKIIKDYANPPDMHFVIAGTGEEEDALHVQVKELDIEEDVELVGWISGEQKEALFKGSQILVLPSYNEGLPIAILEAISYGMPVIATNVGDIRSAVRNGQNGFLIYPGEVERMADDILQIYSDKELYEKMSEQSRRIAENDFSEEQYFEKMIDCYQKSKYHFMKKAGAGSVRRK